MHALASAARGRTRKHQDCALKRRWFGMIAEGKRPWCASCAGAHDGAQDLNKE